MSNDNNLEELFNDLFAYRIELMDINIDENYIIRKLKMELIRLNYNDENINNILYLFYCYFDIPVTINQIENVNIQHLNINGLQFLNIITIPINTIYNQDNPEDNPGDNNNHDDDDMPPLEIAGNINNPNNILTGLPDIPNLLNILLGAPINNIHFEQVLIQPNNNPLMQDVLVTTDENSLNNLSILKISNEQNEKCTICLEEMNIDDEYFDIECKHIFHKGCLETYLKNYNHICPVCRKDIGISAPRI